VGSAPDGKDYTRSHQSLEGEGARKCRIIIARQGLGFVSMHSRAVLVQAAASLPRATSICISRGHDTVPTNQPTRVKLFLELV
jgi:hypothetical protein